MPATAAMFKFRTLLLLPALIASSYGLIHAVDSSTLVSEATYSRALGEGFTKAIIRGYEEACGKGGEVDPNFVPSYENARAAGYTDIDTYWFPCNGSGNNCKSYADQLSEIEATFNGNSMNIGTIWIDFEKDSAVCNNVSTAQPHNLLIDWNKHVQILYSGTMAKLAIKLKPGL